jgi:hypothetical protein
LADLPQAQRFFRPAGSPRLAVISAEPVHGETGRFYVRTAIGDAVGALGGGQTYGPYAAAELTAVFAELTQQFVADGFFASGQHELLEKLSAGSAAVRAAIRIGWRRTTGGCAALLAALTDARHDVCSIIDALGACGDAAAIPAVRPYAERKLLSRRRSAVEALYALGDEAGVAAARERALAQCLYDGLPQSRARRALVARRRCDRWRLWLGHARLPLRLAVCT